MCLWCFLSYKTGYETKLVTRFHKEHKSCNASKTGLSYTSLYPTVHFYYRGYVFAPFNNLSINNLSLSVTKTRTFSGSTLTARNWPKGLSIAARFLTILDKFQKSWSPVMSSVQSNIITWENVAQIEKYQSFSSYHS